MGDGRGICVGRSRVAGAGPDRCRGGECAAMAKRRARIGKRMSQQVQGKADVAGRPDRPEVQGKSRAGTLSSLTASGRLVRL